MTQSYVHIALIIIFVFVVCALINFFTPKIKGRIGESAVIGVLSKLSSEKYKILNNIMLCVDERTVQIDHIVVSIYGIFVIETKNYKGLIYGGEFSEKWTKNINGKKYTFRNPLKQNYGHVKALESLLNLTEDKFIPIVVFSTNATLKVETKKPVIYTNKLKKFIDSYKEEGFNSHEVNELARKIQESNIDSKEMRKKHNSAIRENVKLYNSDISQGVCPKCGGKLVERSGKYGKFMGCSNYPKCRYTLKK